MKASALLLTALFTLPALAEGDAKVVSLLPEYKIECGSCHVAFPPNLLSKADWHKTMTRLDRHFGTDASLDTTARAVLQSYLERNAGQRMVPDAEDEPRITATAWFRHEHEELPARTWKDARVKSAANCTACHKGAEQGRYGEGEITVPGLRQRRARS